MPTDIIALALRWLNNFDEGHFSQCWENASPELKKQIGEQDFVVIMSGKQSERGSVIGRDLQDAGAQMTYHRRPDLVHRVLRFQITSEAGHSSEELITLVKDEDDFWRVANYALL